MNTIETFKYAQYLRKLGYEVREATDRVVVQDPVSTLGHGGAPNTISYTPVTLRSSDAVLRFVMDRS